MIQANPISISYKISLAELYVNEAHEALQEYNYTKASASINAAIAIYEAAGPQENEFPDRLVTLIYSTAAITAHRMGHESEAIEYAQKPLALRPSAGAAAVEAVSLFWQSKDTEAKQLLHEWYDPDPNDPDPSHPLNLAYKPRATPRPPSDE